MDDCATLVINNIRTRELVIGTGDPVLMAHGWGASIDLLQPLALKLSRLGYRCYMLDLPGFGESAEPERPYTVKDYADFCLAYLDQRQLPHVDFFGHSLGGRIGLVLGADSPERLRSMLLSNSAGVKVAPPLHANLRLKLYHSLRRLLESLGADSAAQALRAAFSQRFGSADYQRASPIMRATLVKIVNQDLLAYARRVAVPTVLLWGDADQETPLWMGETLESAIPDVALIVHQGAGHYAYLDQLDQTAAIMHALFSASPQPEPGP